MSKLPQPSRPRPTKYPTSSMPGHDPGQQLVNDFGCGRAVAALPADRPELPSRITRVTLSHCHGVRPRSPHGRDRSKDGRSRPSPEDRGLKQTDYGVTRAQPRGPQSTAAVLLLADVDGTLTGPIEALDR